MKRYYFRNILNQIFKLKVETLILFCISFFISLFLSLLYFFGFNDEMEKTIANSVEMNVEIKNSFVFNKNVEGHNNLDDIENCKEYWKEFVDFLEEINQTENLDYYNYNLVMNVSYYIEENELSYHLLFGISHEDFLKKNEIELLEGRNFTQKEINESMPYLIVSDQTFIKEGNQQRKAKVGDILNVFHEDKFSNRYEIIEMEIIGIYKDVFRDVYASGKNNDFINSKGMITSNGLIKEYVMVEEIAMNELSLNKIIYTVSDSSKYQETLQHLQQAFDELQENMNERIGSSLIEIEFFDDSVSSVLFSIMHIKTIYQIIFMIAIVIVAVIYFSVIYYFLNRKIKEMKIYIALGQSKSKLIGHYLFTYLIVGLTASCVAIVIGYLLSFILNQVLLQDNVRLQNEFLKYFSANTWNKEIVMNEMSIGYSWNIQTVSIILVEISCIIATSVCGVLVLLYHKYYKKGEVR